VTVADLVHLHASRASARIAALHTVHMHDPCSPSATTPTFPSRNGERTVVPTTYWSNNTTTLHLGDALQVLTAMPDASADCLVTSPPYWAKRDYGVPGQYGLETGPASYVATLRAVFSQARRVLADDGTCWLNLGDSYSVGGAAPTGLHTYLGRGLAGRQTPRLGTKNLLGLPWQVALALQDDGWIIRNAIVWNKPTPCPNPSATGSTAGTN
jgi:DNA modification methylase